MKIHFLQPYSFDKRIGEAYNGAIELIKNDDWICITDQDTLKPPLFAERLNAILEEINDDNIILGCMTNRLNPNSEQLVKPMYDEDSIAKHLKMANVLYNINRNNTKETLNAIAGTMMCFKRSTWAELGGFHATSIRFDILLSAHARNAGKRLLIAEGLYIVHLYRYGTINPQKQTNHLTMKAQLAI